MIKEQLEQLIFNYNFDEAGKIFYKLNEKEQDTIISEIAYDNDSILVYTFICYLIVKNNNAFIHSLAAVIMSSALCHIPGAYETAFYHAKIAIALSPNDIGLKEYLLFFYELPEPLLSKNEAIKIAKEILLIDKKSKVAKKIIMES